MRTRTAQQQHQELEGNGQAGKNNVCERSVSAKLWQTNKPTVKAYFYYFKFILLTTTCPDPFNNTKTRGAVVLSTTGPVWDGTVAHITGRVCLPAHISAVVYQNPVRRLPKMPALLHSINTLACYRSI